jgi:hypothetical protein
MGEIFSDYIKTTGISTISFLSEILNNLDKLNNQMPFMTFNA